MQLPHFPCGSSPGSGYSPEIWIRPQRLKIAAISAIWQCLAGESCLESSSFTLEENDISCYLNITVLNLQSVFLKPA